jgi:hypothetical protein
MTGRYAGSNMDHQSTGTVAAGGGGGSYTQGVTAAGDVETRPKNIAQQYFMKI